MKNIEQEYNNNQDKFSQSIIISQLETLLNYSDCFYQRQFLTRKANNHKILENVEKGIEDYFESEQTSGLPSVQYIAESLNIYSMYLNSLLKSLTGLTTQQYIHEKLIEKAREKLSTTELTVSEIAFELGFEHR